MTTLLNRKTVPMREELAELWRFRYLLQMLVARELKVRYKNSVFGFLWSIVPPLLSVLVLTYMVREVFGASVENYSAYLLCGIIPWTFFSSAILDSSMSLLVNYGVIKKVYMPREVIPLAVVISNFIHCLLGWGVYFVAFLLIGPLFHKGTPFLPRMVWFPGILLIQLMLVTGLSLWSAALNTFYEDVKFILQTLFNLIYFLLPILYSADVVYYSHTMRAHPWLFKLYMLNPITSLITGFRWSLLEPIRPETFNKDAFKGFPPIDMDWTIFFFSCLLSFLIAWSGYAYFNRCKWKFVERG